MKIVQISGAYSGAQRIIEDAIHSHLLASGDDSYIFYTYGESSDPKVICYETGFERKLRRGLWKILGKRQISSALSTARLIRHLKRIHPDLVHLHVIHHGHVHYPMLFRYLQRVNVPVVYTMHDMWAFTGGCYHYTDLGCRGYLTGCTSCSQKTEQLDCKRESTSKHFSQKKELLSKIDKLCFTSVSSWVCDEISRTHLGQFPQYTVWNAVPGSHSVPKPEHREGGPFRIIGVASCWTEQKGISRFLALASLLGDGFEIILVGNASETLREAAPKNVTFVGSISDRQELQARYAAADLNLCLSLEETFGMTLVEAALCGTRSMGFDSTAIPYVLHKVGGIVLPVSDVTAVAERIRELAKEHSVCRLTDDEINGVKMEFSVEKMAENYLDIYKERLCYDA